MRDCEDARVVVEGEVLEGHVGCVAETAAAAVGWVAGAYAGPSFHVDAVAHVVGADVTDCDIFDGFESVVWEVGSANVGDGG